MTEIEELQQENEILKARLKQLGRPISKIISPRLRPLRKQKDLMQEQLGILVGVSKMRISDYEAVKLNRR